MPKGYETLTAPSPGANVSKGASPIVSPNDAGSGVDGVVGPSESPQSPQLDDPAQAGIFQRWFPGWSGWYGYGAATSPTEPVRQDSLSTSKSEEMLTPLTSPIHSDPGTPVSGPNIVKPAEQTESDKEIGKVFM